VVIYFLGIGNLEINTVEMYFLDPINYHERHSAVNFLLTYSTENYTSVVTIVLNMAFLANPEKQLAPP